MSPRHNRANCKSKVFGIPVYILWIFLVVSTLALVIPLAVMFGKKKTRTPQSSILVPLYIYPNPGAWDPLYTAIKAHPALNFTLIINPGSGPGPNALPDANYTREIPLLNSFPNVKTIGYVSTNYTSRNLTLTLNDITTYAKWSENATGLGMQGVFLDETPAVYTDASAQFLQACADTVRLSVGFGTDGLVIQNPGTIPDPRFLASCTSSVIVEANYSTYQIHSLKKSIKSFMSENNIRRDQVAVVLHSLGNLSSGDELSLLKELRGLAGEVFVTGLGTDYYSSFWDGWAGWVEDMVVG